MSRGRIGGCWMWQLALAAALVAVAAFGAPAAFAAEASRVLDPTLSLIGGCKEEALDSVQDPGCPTYHPPSTFSDPRAVATDDYGNIYVSSYGNLANGSKGRVDVFCSDGVFISELPVPGATSLAIDSEGNLYVYANPSSGGQVLRFTPEPSYAPQSCKIDYGTTPAVIRESLSIFTGIAINPDNDHLFADFGNGGIVEFSSAEEGNQVVRTTKGPDWSGGVGMAVDGAHDRMYAGAGPTEERIDIFDLTSVTPEDEYEVVGSIEPSSVPAGDFGTQVSVAVDESDGHVFVLDGENCRLYEFEEDGTYLTTIEAPFLVCTSAEEIGVDNGPFSPNGALSDKGRYLFVPSNPKGIGHSYAFYESKQSAPQVKSTVATNISEDEAELQAQVNAGNLETTYVFEYITEQAAEQNVEAGSEAFAGASVAGTGTLPADNLDAPVSAAATGLAAGTSYRFRVVATNEKGSASGVGSFATYPNAPTETSPCSNALFRIRLSSLLPDCRAYELVTPPDTGGHAPLGLITGTFPSRQVSPAGDKVPFHVEGGALPGFGGVGGLLGDNYLATRTDTGWSTAYTGPTGTEAVDVDPGSTSPDQGYMFWVGAGGDSSALAKHTSYVRYPDGHSELVGQGSLGRIDPEATGQLISEGGGHIVFTTFNSTAPPVQLEPAAAPDGTAAVYDRTADGITHVVSMKPGEVPFAAGENAHIMGFSLDGVGIAFEVGNTLYLRYNDEKTFRIGEAVDFAGVAEGGGRIFYVEGGNLEAFDVGEERTIDFATTGDAVPVTVSADGSTAYFVSETAIVGAGANPAGAEPEAGGQNLYRSKEGQIAFVGTVTDRDVEGVGGQEARVDGLGLWVSALNQEIRNGVLGVVPARTTPDGGVLLFKSRAQLTSYDPAGSAEVYRYDAAAEELQCLSCNPTGAQASSDATLQSETREGAKLFSGLAWPENLRNDGRRAFFESSEALVAGDVDGRNDVYEWEAQGVGSCTRPGGCIYLISSPHSSRGEYLWAVSRSGDDVFFVSSSLLVGADTDQTPSIYDARVGGGFAEESEGVCEGEGCRPQLSPPPPLPGTDTPVRGAGDNVKHHCGKGKRRIKHAGKVRCVKKKHHRKHKHRAGSKKKGGHR